MPTARYDSVFTDFDAPVARQVRAEAYDEDIGQHSWVTAADLRADVDRLRLQRHDRLIDLGCGPGGPLTYVAQRVGCTALGLDVNDVAIEAARRRASSLGVGSLVTATQANLDARLPIDDASRDVAMSFDVVIHLRDRAAFFREVARVLVAGGRFLFTDASVLIGAISNEEIATRSTYGFTQFVAPGYNEHALADAGFRVLEIEERTDCAALIASKRLTARVAHRDALVAHEGVDAFDRHNTYLETVVRLSRTRSLARFMYLAETHGH